MRKDDCPQWVYDLFDNSGKWNICLLQSTFSTEVCSKILKISIPSRMEAPSSICLPSKSGAFTVKSAYLTLLNRRFDLIQPTTRHLWRKVWNSEIHGRYKHFLWKILHDALHVKQRLKFVIGPNDSGCMLCGGHEESLEHLFMLCPIIRKILFASKWSYRMPMDCTSLKDWIGTLLELENMQLPGEMNRKKFLNFVMVTLDVIWKRRNKLVFEGENFDIQVVQNWIEKIAMEHWRTQFKRMVTIKSQSLETEWLPPSKGVYKFNCNAAVSNGMASVAWIARNHKGNVVAAATESYPAISVDQMGITKMIIESDSSNMVVAVLEQGESDRLTCHLVENAREFYSISTNIRIRKIPRKCNGATHNLAGWARSSNWSGQIPLNVLPNVIFCLLLSLLKL